MVTFLIALPVALIAAMLAAVNFEDNRVMGQLVVQDLQAKPMIQETDALVATVQGITGWREENIRNGIRPLPVEPPEKETPRERSRRLAEAKLVDEYMVRIQKNMNAIRASEGDRKKVEQRNAAFLVSDKKNEGEAKAPPPGTEAKAPSPETGAATKTVEQHAGNLTDTVRIANETVLQILIGGSEGRIYLGVIIVMIFLPGFLSGVASGLSGLSGGFAQLWRTGAPGGAR